MAYIYDLTDTWNAGGTTFNAIKMNVTDSASASASKLVTLQTNGTEHFSVTKGGQGYFSGNVGIGTSSPLAKLDVRGSLLVRQADASYFNFNSTSTVADIEYSNTGAVRFVFNGVTETMRITSTGSVGIGTTTPSNRFVVSNAGANGFEFNTTDNIVQTYNRATSLYTDFNLYSLNHRIFTGTSPTEKMRIDSSGNVGIGTSSPGSKLHVAGGNVYITGSGAYIEPAAVAGVLAFDSTSGDLNISARSNGGNTFTRFFTSSGGNGAERMRIDSSGNLLVGATSSTGARITATGASAAGIYVSNNTSGDSTKYHLVVYENGTERGSITSNGSNTAYNTSSDVRLKENIADAEDAASLIDAIQVRKFDWKDGGQHQRYGFVAQELIEVAPEAVSAPADEDAMMGVDYSKLVPMLVKEIQSLRARVAQLEGN